MAEGPPFPAEVIARAVEVLTEHRTLYETVGVRTDGFAVVEGWIRCRLCWRASHNPHDVTHHYCGHCHVFLDDLQMHVSLLRLEGR